MYILGSFMFCVFLYLITRLFFRQIMLIFFIRTYNSLFHLLYKHLPNFIIFFFFSICTANFFFSFLNEAIFFFYLFYCIAIMTLEKKSNVKFFLIAMGLIMLFINFMFDSNYIFIVDNLFFPFFVIVGLIFLKKTSKNIKRKILWIFNLYFQIFFEKKYKLNFKRIFFFNYFFFRETFLYNIFVLLFYFSHVKDNSFISKVEIIFLLIVQLLIWLFLFNLINKYFPLKGKKFLICCALQHKIKYVIGGVSLLMGGSIYYNLKLQNLDHQFELDKTDLILKYKYGYLNSLDPSSDQHLIKSIINEDISQQNNNLLNFSYQKTNHASLQVGDNNIQS